MRSRRGCLFVFGLGGLGTSDFLIECIDVGVLDHGVERLKNAVLEQRSVHTFRQVVKLLKRTLELGVALVIGGIHSEHAHEHLLKHRGLAVGGRHVLTQVARLDMEA